MPTESDPITLAIRQRAMEAAEKLIPMCKDVSTELAEGYYDAATNLFSRVENAGGIHVHRDLDSARLAGRQ